MRTEKFEGSDKVYLSVLSDGKFHQTVPAGTEGAIVREYEDKNGVMQSKSELITDSAVGFIKKISFVDTDFGTNIQISMDDDGIISLGTASSFGEDIMKKLPNVDFNKEVKLAPYSVDYDGKNKKGITIYQDGEKLESFYWDKEKKQGKNGLPKPDGDIKKFKKDDWKMYYMTVRKFLMSKVEELPIFEAVESLTEENNLDNF